MHLQKSVQLLGCISFAAGLFPLLKGARGGKSAQNFAIFAQRRMVKSPKFFAIIEILKKHRTERARQAPRAALGANSARLKEYFL